METRKPSFFWQGVLILTPVLILTGIGVAALWKERQFAMRDAEGRAQQLAGWVASRIINELDHLAATTPGDACIQFDKTGKLIFPRDFERVPAPQPLNLDELTPEQRRRWEAAQGAGLNPEGLSDLALRWERFLETKPPARFAALARFRRGLLLEQSGHAPEAARDFAEITNRFAAAFSESGLPLDLLA